MSEQSDKRGSSQSPAEIGRRARAARSYAGFSIGDLAAHTGLGAQTIKRIEAGTRQARRYELWALAESCGVPRTFFEADLEELLDPSASVVAALTRIEARLTRIEAGCRFGGS